MSLRANEDIGARVVCCARIRAGATQERPCRCVNGHENPDGSRYCNTCGLPIAVNGEAASSRTPIPPAPVGPSHRSFWKGPAGLAILALAAVAILGGVITALGTPRDEASVPPEVTTGTPSVEPEATSQPSSAPPEENPDGTYTTSCDYLLGNFTQSQQGYRAIATAKVKNTGNIGIFLTVRAHWDMVRRPSLVSEKSIRLKVHQSKKVDFSEVLSSDELDAMQNAALDFDDWCNVKATITDTFGAVQS